MMRLTSLKKLLPAILLSLVVSTTTTHILAHACHRMSLPTGSVYVGVGGSWSTINESFHSTLITTTERSSQDKYLACQSRLNPMLQVGYWRGLCDGWLWGLAAQWQYLYYATPNDNAPQGEHLPNATFSSINFFGPEVLRDFNSQSRVNNEVLFLFYMGKQLQSGYVYLGVGPALFTVSNRIYVSSIHRPNGVGNHLTSSSVKADNTIWGGSIQVGYNYYLDSSFFLNFNYSYAQTARNAFNNAANTAILNGFFVPGPTTLNINRSIRLRVQSVMISINKAFAI